MVRPIPCMVGARSHARMHAVQAGDANESTAANTPHRGLCRSEITDQVACRLPAARGIVVQQPTEASDCITAVGRDVRHGPLNPWVIEVFGDCSADVEP